MRTRRIMNDGLCEYCAAERLKGAWWDEKLDHSVSESLPRKESQSGKIKVR